MSELINEFARHLEHGEGLSRLTCDAYPRALARLASALEDRGRSLETATVLHLEEFLSGLVGDGMCKRTRTWYVCAMRKFFKWLYGRGGRRPEDNPARSLQYQTKGFALPRSMELKHIGHLFAQPDLETFAGIRDMAMLLLLTGCGLRVSELINLNQGDLSFTPDPAGGFDFLDLRIIGKGDRERVVSAPKEVGAAVRAYLGHPQLKEADRFLPSGDQVLFVNLINRAVLPDQFYGENRRLRQRSFYEILRTYGRRAKIPSEQLHPHALRHLYATHLLEKGADIYVIKEMLGHASLETTQVYLKMTSGRRREIALKKTPVSSINTPFHDLVRRVGGK